MIENPKTKYYSLLDKEVVISTEYVTSNNFFTNSLKPVGGLKKFCSEFDCEYQKNGKCNVMK